MSGSPKSVDSMTSRQLRRASVAVLAAGMLVGAAAGAASAKEIASGGNAAGGAPTTGCQPVTSLSYKGDARAGETGLATIQVSYGVKPCDSSRAVVVDTQLYLNSAAATVAYDNPSAPLSGKFLVSGVKANTSYIAKVTVTDAATGALVGTASIFAAAVTKPGV